MRLLKNGRHNKEERWRGRNGLRQQRPVQFVDKFHAATAPASIVGSSIGQSVMQSRNLLQKHTNLGSILATDTESMTVNLKEENNFIFNGPQKRQRIASSASATKHSRKLIRKTLFEALPSRRDEFVAPYSRKRVFSTMPNIPFCHLDVLLWLFLRTESRWIGFAKSKSFWNFPICLIQISIRLYLRSSRPP